jgi:putative membrane protein
MTMWLDATLAYLHFTAIFVLFAFLSIELVMLKGEHTAAAIRQLGRMDLWYFGAAMAVLASGFARLVMGAKGADFYLSSWPIYVKIGLFVGVAVISVTPTLRFIQWRRQVEHDAAWRVPEAEQRRMRRLVLLEVHLAALIPIFAVMMARGLGR